MHRAEQLRVKVFPGRTKPEEIESLIHDWLEKNPDSDVVDIKYGYVTVGNQRPACPFFSAMIIYKKG